MFKNTILCFEVITMKKLSALILSFILVFLFSACKNTTESPAEKSTTDYAVNETDYIDVDNKEESTVSNIAESQSGETTTIIDEINSESPDSWTKEQIIDYYKKAAALSHSSTKSQHTIELKKISVNNGEYENVFNFITPIMAKLLANNSSDKDGITGGYKNLSAADVASAKAYKSGKNTVIELVMKNQVSGANEDALSGSVGHAITAVGDIGVVTKQLDDLGLPLELSEKDTKIVYTNPTVKVVINENGKIINGTWKYTVAINLNNYKAFGKHVDTTSVVMDNILTVNGGFKK